MSKLIYKILRPHEWAAALETDAFPGAPIDVADGYVHFSAASQVPETAEKYFGDTEKIHLLGFEPDVFPDGSLKWEKSRGGALFPHLYAPLDVALARERLTLSRRIDDTFDFSFLTKDKD
ncbi:DUF952 domain-containing protein [Kordiimonas aestuarii]|uniref:DUF952 domain-containing protein n=1 Tax=Kordiimonas aestuarii TaxID=1005925 RepID=UPI0021D311C8|nr:DUF952 domain-containing protein [Kordiimonas aestuarii]